jgi:hypothetical protein
MPISETQLETWSHQGQSGQFTSTYATLKAVLHDRNAPYANHSFETFLQGSYGNDTNIHADSDVDIVIWTDEVYYSDLSNLNANERAEYDKGWSAATYTLADFKREVVAWLTQKYGNAVKPGAKAVFISGNGSRRDADVIVAAEFRRYYKFTGHFSSDDFVKGICFFNSSGVRIENFPKQHSENCTTKHQGTRQWFKPSVRTYKHVRNKMIDTGMIEEGLAPSYYLEGLLYNVPADRFGGTYVQNFTDTLDWLVAADRSDFVCANEQFYLLRENSPVTWRPADCTKFLTQAVQLWHQS